MRIVNTRRVMMAALALVLALGGIATVLARQDEGTAWLGVRISDEDGGVTVTEVLKDSPADDAGLKVGDVIAALDDVRVDSAQGLVDAIQAHQPGDEVVLTVESGDETRDVPVTLGERPAEAEAANPSVVIRPGMEGMLNLMGLEATITGEGLRIDRIDPESAFADSGLQEGDVITRINGESVTDFGVGMMRLFRFGETVTFTVLRDGEEVEVETELAKMLPDVGQAVTPVMPQGWMQLGVSYATLTPDLAADEDLTVTEGALIREVYADTAAEKAGLQVGDVITEVNGDAVDQERTLSERLYAYEEGDTVTLTVLRDGEVIEVEVTLGPRGGVWMMPGDGEYGFRFGPNGMGPGMRGQFFQAHPFWGHMFPDGEFEFGRGGRFHFGPDGFEFIPDTGSDEVPPAPSAPPAEEVAPAADGSAA